MGSVFAFVNMKGGVGKTTASVLFAETLSKFGKSVLFVDLDAQASASFAIAGYDGLMEASRRGVSLCGYFGRTTATGKPQRFDPFILKGASTLSDCRPLDLLCSHPDLRLMEREFARQAMRKAGLFTRLETAFQGARRPVFDEIRRQASIYDFVIVDCPPGVSLFVEAGVFAADVVICPTAPEPLSTLGLETMISRFYRSHWFLEELVALGRPVPPLKILFSRVDGHSARHRAEMETIETLLEREEWREHAIDILDEVIETAPVLAGAFFDPGAQATYDGRYRGFAGRAADISAAILQAAPRREAAA